MVRVQIFKSFKSSTNIKLFRTIPILTDDCYNMIKIRKKTKTKTKTKKKKDTTWPILFRASKCQLRILVARMRGSLNPDLFGPFYPWNDREQRRHATVTQSRGIESEGGDGRPPFHSGLCLRLYGFAHGTRFGTHFKNQFRVVHAA